jgi:hypothetical protein
VYSRISCLPTLQHSITGRGCASKIKITARGCTWRKQ